MNLGTLTAILAVVDKITPEVSKISGNVGKAMSSIKTAVAGAFTVDAIVGAISRFTEFTGKVTDTAAKLGITTTAVQQFELAFKDSGVSIDSVGAAIGEMGKRLVTGDSGAVNALATLSLKAADLVNLAPDQAFTKIADAVAGIQNPMERATAAQEIFGKGGKDLLAGLNGTLAETTQGFADMGLIMSADAVAAGDALGDSLGHLATKGMNLLGSVLGPFIPIITKVVDGFAQLVSVLITVDRWLVKEIVGAFGRAKTALFDFLSGLAETASRVPLLGSAFKGIGDAAGWLKDRAVSAGQALKETYAGIRAELVDQTAPAAQTVANIVGVYGDRAKAAAEKTRELAEKLKAFWKEADALGREAVPGLTIAIGKWETVAVDHVTLVSQTTREYGEAMKAAEDWALKNGQVLAPSLKAVSLATKDAEAAAAKTAATWSQVGSRLTGAITGALQGGGSVGKALGGEAGQMLGSKLGTSIGSWAAKNISGALGSAIGGAAGSVLPVVGTLLGSLAGSAIGKLFGGGEGKQANNLRDQIMAAAGGTQELARRAAEAGTSIDQLLRARDTKGVQAAWETLNGQLSQHADKIARAEQVAAEYGITFSQMGEKFKQAKLDELAQKFVTDMETLKVAGVDMTTITAGMGDEFAAYIQRAIEAGATVPRELQPIAEEMIRQGTLVARNTAEYERLNATRTGLEQEYAEAMKDTSEMGIQKQAALRLKLVEVNTALERTSTAFDSLDDIPWATNMNTMFTDLMAKLGTFIDKLESGLGGALGRIPRDIDINFNGRYRGDGDFPGFASGSQGIRDFGGGTLALLHGRERVQTEAQMHAEQRGSVTVHNDFRGALFNDYGSQQRFADLVNQAVMDAVYTRARVGVAGA